MPNILAVEAVRLTGLSLQTLGDVWASNSAGPLGRPVAQLTFGLNYYFSGLDPFFFKLTNLVIHVANGALVFLVALRLFASPESLPGGRKPLFAAAVLAALWLFHPIQVLPVLHVVQRMTSLSAFFLLAALLCHLRGRSSGGPSGLALLCLGWGVFWPLSFLSKETGLLFPFFVLAWELIIRRAETGGLDRFARAYSALAAAGLALMAAYMLSPLAEWLWAGYGQRNFSLTERVLTEGRVLWFYIGLILFPRLEAFGLFHDDIPVSATVLVPWTTLPALIGLVALAWLAWWSRKRIPLVSFGLAWFLVGHAMESTVLPLEIAHEHRNYLPSFGILLAVVALLMRSLGNAGPMKTTGITLLVVMLAYFPFVTALRAAQFGDEVRRTQLEAQHHRASARSQHEAGRVLAEYSVGEGANSPAHHLARVHYELAGQLDPNFKMNWLGLIHLNCQANLPVERVWLGELENRLRHTPFAPGDKTTLYSLKEMSIAGSICLGRADVDALFAAAIANPGVSSGVRAMLHSWHADYLWLRESDLSAARAALRQSLALNPGSPSNRLKWAQLQLFPVIMMTPGSSCSNCATAICPPRSERPVVNCWPPLVSLADDLLQAEQSMTDTPRFSIIVPARNEAAGLRRLLPDLTGVLDGAEILVVDDGSDDDTAAVCAEFGITRLRHHYPLGNGAAIKAGARAATGDVLIFMDADGQHLAEDIPLLLAKFAEGYDMVVGARQSGSHAGAHRAVANDLFSRFASWMVMQNIEDLTSGFRIVRAEKFRKFMYLLPNGFSYPTTITMSFFRAGFSVGYVPIHTPRRIGTSHIRPLARWRALPADHHQGRHACIPRKSCFCRSAPASFLPAWRITFIPTGLAAALPT